MKNVVFSNKVYNKDFKIKAVGYDCQEVDTFLDGINIEIVELEREISALKETGIDELVDEIKKLEDKSKIKVFDSELEKSITSLQNELPKEEKHKRFIAVKLLENDTRSENYLKIMILI